MVKTAYPLEDCSVLLIAITGKIVLILTLNVPCCLSLLSETIGLRPIPLQMLLIPTILELHFELFFATVTAYHISARECP